MRMEVENQQEENTQKLQLCACLGRGGWWWLLRLLSSKMTAAASVGVVSGDTVWKGTSSCGKLGVVVLCVFN